MTYFRGKSGRFYGLLHGKMAEDGQKDLSASAVFSNYNMTCFGVTCPKPGQPPFNPISQGTFT
jgi:hypothetical protein